MMAIIRPVVFFTICFVAGQGHAAQQYLGKFLGKLSELHHGVSGEVYAVDARTLHLKDFTYDGEGPAAYFWAGSTRTPGAAGFRVRDENGSGAVLKRYRRKSITLTLPEGKTLNNIKWFSVWCEEFAVNFGDVKIPRGFDYPKPQKVDALRGVHGVSSDNVVIVDAQTLLIPNFSYDGEAPDAKFWVGRGTKPSPQGIRIPDENGKEIPLRRYDHKTVVLTLPGDLTVFDIGHFGVWCEAFTVDFGHVRIPQQINIPPSLKMLGVSPQSKLNCEVLYDNLAFEVRWAVAGESIVLQLVAKLDDGEYMSFGVSGDDSKTVMIGGDVVVAWVDKQTLKGYAQDYYLEAKSQCSGPRGSCPDERLAENTNNIRLLNAAMVNGYSIVTYQRPLKASDELDREIYTNRSQAIIWAVGPLNQRNEVSFHSQYTKNDHLLDFGRPASWNCPIPEGDNTQSANTPVQTTTRKPEPNLEPKPVPQVEPERRRTPERRRGGGDVSERRRVEGGVSSRRRASNTTPQTTLAPTTRSVATPRPVSNRNAWHIPPIECYEPDDGVFYAQMGPTGGKRGYPAITGHVGWGISWYINGLLIPEINVVRGKTYTFVVEGGLDPEVPAKYHPFYITDDPIGGYEYKTPEERQNVQIFAGVKQTRDGKVYPTGVGRLCHWTHTGEKEADDFDSFGAYQRTLELRCDAGEPGVITWTPDADTPDTVYYQCFTHRYLGWKINVLDSCDTKSAASEPKPQLALPNNGDLKSSSSILVETRINPNDLFQTKQISDRPAEDEDDDPRPLDSDKSYHQNFHSSPEIFYPRISSTPPTKDTTTVKIGTSSTTSSTVKPKPFVRHPPKPQHFKMRRPFPPNHPPPFVVKPFMMRRPPPHVHFKKPIYRIPYRNRSVVRPNQEKKRPNNKEPVAMNQFVLKSVQPSIQEVSTTTEKYSSELISIRKDVSTLRPAINTGFHPESVVIEGGFKPIIKEIQKRISLNETQEDSIGVIKLNPEPNNSQKYTEYFEPMFIPSPPDRHSLLNKKNITVRKKAPSIMVIVKHVARSAELEQPESEMEDEIAMAAERVESYYLPPDNKRTKPIDRIKKPSNIDIPPGTVVTFDGKTVSGVSLTAPVSENNFKSQKATEYLRLSPQFGPFQGEIPPLETQNINVANLPQLSSQAVISRDLNAPAPTSPQTTKLSPVRLRQIRNKRYAHHTPEHTLEQQRQKEYDSEPTNKSSYVCFNYKLIYVVVLTLIHIINH